MSGRAELHFHLLPGVDDGPSTEDESVELARMALADGTTTIVATPHVRDLGSLEEVPERVRELRERLEREHLPLAVHPGGELAQEDVLAHGLESLDVIAQGPPGARWLLLEAPLFSAPLEGLHAAADELRGRGFGVLLAHPERCPDLFTAGQAPLRRELERGARLLLNATSLTGLHGKDPRRLGMHLVREGAAAAIASDAHRISRGPALSDALETMLAAGVERGRARLLVEAAPAAVLREGLGAH